MPSDADVLVAAFRSWLDGRGRGGPFGPLHLAPAYPQQLAGRRQLLDRWAHTQSCADCSRGFRTISALRAAAGAAAALALSAVLCSLLTAAASAGGGAAGSVAGALAWPALRPAAWCAAAGAAAALLWRALSKLREKFIFVDYVHAER